MLAFGLTARERQVAELVIAGLSNVQLAGELRIGLHTAKDHVKAVLRKTGANTRVLVKGADHAENVHADGESVYWMSGPKVLRADKKTGETKTWVSGSCRSVARRSSRDRTLGSDRTRRFTTHAERVGLRSAVIFFATAGSPASRARSASSARRAVKPSGSSA